MKYTDQQIRATIKDFVIDTRQREIQHVIAFCLGYYGYITNQIWRQIVELVIDGVIIQAEERS